MKKDQIINRYTQAALNFADAIRIPIVDSSTRVQGKATEVLAGVPLSQLYGKAMMGMRVSAIADADELTSGVDAISSFVHQHVPFTLVVFGEWYETMVTLKNSGAILLRADGLSFEPMFYYGQVLSERALCPVIIFIDDWSSPSELLLTTDQRANWFGNGRDAIESPTSTQALIFGPQRRRIPKYLQHDQAVLVNASKDQELKEMQYAAEHLYTQSELAQLISSTAVDFEKLTGRAIRHSDWYGAKQGKRAIIVAGSVDLSDDHDLQRFLKKKDIALVVINQLYPCPYHLIRSEWKDIQLLEPLTPIAQHQLAKELRDSSRPTSTSWQTGWFGGILAANSLLSAAHHLVNEGVDEFYINIPLTLERSRYPKHQVLLQHMSRLRSDLDARQVLTPDSGVDAEIPAIPDLVRSMDNGGASYAMVGRFNDDTIIPLKTHQELVADPFQGFNMMPAATSYFIDRRSTRKDLPVFVPEHASDLSDLVNSCSFAALPSTLFTVDQLVGQLMRVKRPNGEGIRHLMPLKNKLIKALQTSRTDDIKDLGAWLLAATVGLIAEAKDAEALRAEIEALINKLGSLPVVFDDELYHKAEKRKKGTGLIFSLAVNPYSCTACGHCALVGETACMRMQPQDKLIDDMRSTFSAFLELPSVDNETLQHLLHSYDDPFAGLMFDKSNYHSYAGTSTSKFLEYESLIRYQLQVCALEMNTTKKHQIDAIQDVLGLLNDKVKQSLGDTLPVRNIEALNRVLEQHNEDRIDAQQLLDEWGRMVDFKPLDRKKLERKLSLIESLSAWRQRLQKGSTGGGERYTIVIDESLKEQVEYPYNPFLAPAIQTKTKDTAAVVLGIAEAMQREFLAEQRLLRKAALEAKEEYIPAVHESELASLSWGDLSDDVRSQAPPVLVFARSGWLRAVDQGSLFALLENAYPTRIMMIDDGVNSNEYMLRDIEIGSSGMWSLIAHSNAFVAQLSLSDRRVLFDAMTAAMNYPGCSLMQVLVPDADAFDVHEMNWRELALLATSTRSFLEWVYDPRIDEQSIAANITTYVPDVMSDLIHVEIVREDDEIQYPMSFADYAFMQKGLKARFNPVKYSEDCILMDSFLALSASEQKKYIPVILRQEGEEWKYYQPDAAVVKASAILLKKFRNMREWAGLYTEYPDKLAQKMKEELSKEYEAAQQAFEQKLNDEKRTWEANYLNEVRSKMKETLLDLSGM